MDTKDKQRQEMFNEWYQDPSNWKWGIIYFNKNDKRIFPPKRRKYFGWTINFANPYSVLALLAIIAMITAIAFITDYTG